MLDMINQGVLPAAAEDLSTYDGTKLAGPRPAVYAALADATASLQAARDAWPTDDEVAAANYAASTIKLLMAETRAAHDAAEKLISNALYPYPTYHEMLFRHQEDV